MYSSIILLVTLGVSSINGFIYDDVDSWGGTCKTGKKQSPINLCEKDAKKQELELKLDNFKGQKYCADVTNNGYTVNIKFKKEDNNGKIPCISGDGLDSNYILDGINFRWHSQHVFDNQSYPAEVAFIHRDEKYKTLDEAQTKPKGLAVLSALLKIDKKAPKIMEKVINAAPEKVHDSKQVCGIDVCDFLPKDLNSFFRYEGSVPMPKCDESITWSVFKDTGCITQELLDKLKTTKDEDGKPIECNARPVQPLNDRTVILAKRKGE